MQPIDPAPPDDAPERLSQLAAIEACHSVAGVESYILQVRVASPAELEQLLQEMRAAAGVSTRTTVILSTPWEGRSLRHWTEARCEPARVESRSGGEGAGVETGFSAADSRDDFARARRTRRADLHPANSKTDH